MPTAIGLIMLIRSWSQHPGL